MFRCSWPFAFLLRVAHSPHRGLHVLLSLVESTPDTCRAECSLPGEKSAVAQPREENWCGSHQRDVSLGCCGVKALALLGLNRVFLADENSPLLT